MNRLNTFRGFLCVFAVFLNTLPFAAFASKENTLFPFTVVTKFQSDTLSLEELTSFFPKKINGLERSSIHVKRESKTAIGIYGELDYSISITDDTFSELKNILEFNSEYELASHMAWQKKRIAMVLDGYRTITEVEDDLVQITFVFKNRYLVVIKGFSGHTPYQTWNFMQLNLFSKLPGLPKKSS